MTDKERYATIGTWAEVFQEEGAQIDDLTIRRHLIRAKMIAETARTKTGHIIRNGFYAESDVRKACAEFLQDFPHADNSGFIIIGDETYGTVSSLSRLLGISHVAINPRIRASSLESKQARDKQGHVRDFYSLSEVRKFCEDLIQDIPQADENGLIRIGDETYGTGKSFSRLLSLSIPTILSRIKQGFLKPIQGKDTVGRVRDFYTLSEVRKLCADLLQNLFRADENGFFEINGETYGTLTSLSRVLGISQSAIEYRIRQSPLKPIQGKDRGGRIWDFYSLSEVRKLCADLIQDIPQADENGLIRIDDETYGTITSLSRTLGISQNAIQSRIQHNLLKPIQGKDKSANVQGFYPLAEVRKFCTDLIAKRKKE